jgi:tryptophanase
MAQGFEEVVHEDYLAYRIRSVEYVGERLTAAGIPIMQPPGGHAIYIDAAALCPHIPREQFPGQAVVCGLYRIGGVRTVEIGSVMFGKGAITGSNSRDASLPARLELVRLAMPRRVYTQSHMDYVVEVCIELAARRHELRGLRMINEPPVLRHFTARFEEV